MQRTELDCRGCGGGNRKRGDRFQWKKNRSKYRLFAHFIIGFNSFGDERPRGTFPAASLVVVPVEPLPPIWHDQRLSKQYGKERGDLVLTFVRSPRSLQRSGDRSPVNQQETRGINVKVQCFCLRRSICHLIQQTATDDLNTSKLGLKKTG